MDENESENAHVHCGKAKESFIIDYFSLLHAYTKVCCTQNVNELASMQERLILPINNIRTVCNNPAIFLSWLTVIS